MSRSLFEQLDQVRGSRTFVDTLDHSYAEQCGRNYEATTLTVTSGSATIVDDAAFDGSEVGNFLVVDTGNAAGVYEITAVSGTEATVSPTPTGTDAAASGRKHYRQNLEDDLNYLRRMMNLVVGESNWNDTPNTDLRNMAYLVPVRPNYVGETSQYSGERAGTVSFAISDIDQTGYISTGAPAGEYTDNTSNGTAGNNIRFTDDNTMVISIAGGFYPADTGTIQILGDGAVLGTLDLATAWTNDGCAYEESEDDVGNNPDHTSTHTGTDIIDLTNRRCMNTTVDSFPSFWPPYQIASMTATVTLDAGFHGQITIQHSIGGSSNYTYATFWVDTTSQAITGAVPTVASGSAVFKWLSGVPYATTGHQYSITVNDSNDLFDRGYVTNPLTLNVSEFNASSVTPTLVQLSLTEPLDITDTIGSYNTTITVGGGNFRDLDARCTATYRGVFANGTSASSASGPYRIDTYGVTSTDTVEYFDDEDKRMVGTEDFSDTAITHTDSTWDSTTDLSGDTQLVVYNGTLKYPTLNHSTAVPAGPDYSSETGTNEYYRVFIATGAFSAGTITFAGWSNALSEIQGANVQVHLRLPGCTDYGNGNNGDVWQDLSVDQQTYGADGCLGSGSSGTSVAFSFGPTSSSSFGNRIVMRVRFLNSSATTLNSITFNPTL